MSDLNFQNFSTVQSALQPAPVTVASAASIVPTGLVTFLTGTVAVTNITPPVSGAHMLVLVFVTASPGGVTATAGVGGIKNTVAATINVPMLCIFDPVTQLYWCK